MTNQLGWASTCVVSEKIMDKIMDTTNNGVAKKKSAFCVTCTFIHVLRDKIRHVATWQKYFRRLGEQSGLKLGPDFDLQKYDW